MQRILLVLLLLATTGFPAVTAMAREGRATHAGQDHGTSLNEAVRQVRRETGGRVLSAETISKNGRRVHRIKVLTPAGQMRIVTVDADSRSR